MTNKGLSVVVGGVVGGASLAAAATSWWWSLVDVGPLVGGLVVGLLASVGLALRALGMCEWGRVSLGVALFAASILATSVGVALAVGLVAMLAVERVGSARARAQARKNRWLAADDVEEAAVRAEARLAAIEEARRERRDERDRLQARLARLEASGEGTSALVVRAREATRSALELVREELADLDVSRRRLAEAHAALCASAEAARVLRRREGGAPKVRVAGAHADQVVDAGETEVLVTPCARAEDALVEIVARAEVERL